MKSTFTVEKELEAQDEDNICQRYSIVSHLTQIMLALGFFGTIFNLSGEFFKAFSKSTVSTEVIKAGVSQFTHALSTALDTIILPFHRYRPLNKKRGAHICIRQINVIP